MLVRIDPARTGAAVVSIPPNSWVAIPGQGKNKIDSAYTSGGPPLLVETVEQLTGIRVDHFGVIDFAGFRSMVDVVGGIDVGIAAPTSNDGVHFRGGANHLDGAKTLAYLRQRQGLPRGDLDRAQRQQNVLRALLEKAAADVSTNPVQLYRLLDAVSRSTSVDDTMNNDALRKLRREIGAVQPAAVTFLGPPVGGLGGEGTQPVVYLDDHRALALWEALRSNSASAYARLHPDDSLGAMPP
jgi:LCP family protein required for cell wall assembly